MDWLSFIALSIGLSAMLYLPGVLLLRAKPIPWIESISFAPIITSIVYSGLAAIESCMHIRASWTSLFLPLLVISLIVFFSRQRRTSHVQGNERVDPKASTIAPVGILYLMIGIASYTFIVLSCLPSPDGFIQKYDNTMHLNLIQAFYLSGDFSPLHCSEYPDIQEGAFYPALFHMLAAMLMTFAHCSAAAAENVVLFSFIATVFPLGMYSLLETFFPNRLSIWITGAFSCVFSKGSSGTCSSGLYSQTFLDTA